MVPESWSASFSAVMSSDTLCDAGAEREGEQPLKLPPGYEPGPGQVVVPTPEAIELVKYLQGLDHTYPVLPEPPKP